MGEVSIPEEAWDRAWIEVSVVRDAAPRLPNDADTGDVVTAALAAAAPLIVAADYEKTAAILAKRDSIPNDEWDHGFQAGLEAAASGLRTRASVLRGEGQQ